VTSGEWVRFSEYDDVLASTDLLALVAPSLKATPTNWKWMILAAHSGLQGAIVCAIKDSTGTNILTKKSAAAVLAWLDKPEGDRPPQYLDNCPALLSKYRKKYPHIYITVEQLKDLRILHNEFRNNFTHFAPMQWSIEAAGLPRIVIAALNIIEGAMQQHQVDVHLSDTMRLQLTQNLASARSSLAEENNRYSY
jgi:hypothetical protein